MPLVTYSVLRLALLAACFGLGYWAGLRTWLLLVVATFAALGLSYVLLGGPREAAARYLAERAQRRAAGEPDLPASARDDAAHEDAVVDRAEAEAGRARGTGAPSGSPGEPWPATLPDEGRRASSEPGDAGPGAGQETASPSPSSTP